MARHGLSPNKGLGQHFLVSTKVVDAILARAVGVATILEVGPGPGILTQALSRNARVIALELDRRAIGALAESAPAAEVIHTDALAVDWAELLLGAEGPVAFVSNMPYRITGPLLRLVQRHRGLFVRAVAMMQREVADRLLAPPGNRDRGAAGVVLQELFEISVVVDAPPGAFEPPPKVRSRVLEFVPRTSWLGMDDGPLDRLAHAGFRQPRKKLVSNLVEGLGLDAAAIERLLAPRGYLPTVRAHELTGEAWRDLLALRLENGGETT